MSKKQEILGKAHQRQETPLAVIDARRGTAKPQQPRVYTPEDAEFHEYTELLRGFFEKFTRWNTILNDETYRISDIHSGLQVLQTPQGLSIAPFNIDSSQKQDARGEGSADKAVLIMTRAIGLFIPQHGLYTTHFNIGPGEAGRHLLTRPDDGRTLNEVRIDISDQNAKHLHRRYQDLHIFSSQYKDGQSGASNRQDIWYELLTQKGVTTFETAYTGPGDKMTNALAVSTINTIDSLIPNPPQQRPPLTRVTPELPTPRQLPATRRGRIALY